MRPATEQRVAAGVILAWLALWAWTVLVLPLESEHIKDEIGHVEQVLRVLAGTASLGTVDLGYPPAWRAWASASGALFGPSRAALALPSLLACFAVLGLAAAVVPLTSRARVVVLLSPALIPFSFRVTTEWVVVLAVTLAAAALVVAGRRPGLLRWTLVGVAVAGALLAKQTSVLFLLVPTAWCFRTLARRPDRGVALGSLALALAGAGLLAWLGFYRHVGLADTVGGVLSRATTGPTSAEGGLARLLGYPAWLTLLVGAPALLAALVGRRDGESGWLLAAAAVPLALLMGFPVQEPEYLLPAVPLIAVAVVRDLHGATSSHRGVATALIALWALGAGAFVAHDRWLVGVTGEGLADSLDGLVEAWRAECPDGCSACVLTAQRRGHAEALVRVGLRGRSGDGLDVTGRCSAAPEGVALVFHDWDRAPMTVACLNTDEREWYVGSFGGEEAWPGNAAAFDAIAARGRPLADLPQGPEGPAPITVCRVP